MSPTTQPSTPTTYRGLPPSLRTPSFTSQLPASPLSRYSSIGSSQNNEDPLILEVGAKLLRIGFANEQTPRYVLAWNDVFFRRVGDKIAVEDVGRRRNREIWSRDLVDVDLGLVEDMVERGLREAYNKYLLVDPRVKKIILPIPPLFPTRLLSAIIATVFRNFQVPGVTVMLSPVLATIAAGLRSALVVDIGWHETIVTPVYELRPIEGRGIGVHGRSRRGIRVLFETWRALLTSRLPPTAAPLDPHEVEDIMERLGWCRSLTIPMSADDNPVITLPLSSATISLPFSNFSEPTESAFFAPTTEESTSPDTPDDDDAPLPKLLHNALSHCTVDIRAACLPRIIFVGGGSRIPGLQARVVDELREVIETDGWRPKARPLKTRPNSSLPREQPGFDWRREIAESPTKQMVEGGSTPLEKGEVRGVRTLGVYAGASLLAGLKIRGKVELDREKFLTAVQQGGLGLPAGV